MPYVVVEDFKGGLDVRRSVVDSVPGTLRSAQNVHLTRGGEVETRLGVTFHSSLPAAASFGMVSDGQYLHIFQPAGGAGVDTGILKFVTLTHPISAAVLLTSVKHSTLFDGKVYVVAGFADGQTFHFYDGVHVSDWIDGKVLLGDTSYTRLAALMAATINADSRFVASSASNVLTVAHATEGTNFTTATLTENVSGGVNDQTLTSVQTVAPATPVTGVKAFSKLSVLSGALGAAAAASGTITITGGSGNMTGITFMGQDLLDGVPVAYDTDNPTTAEAVKEAINDHSAEVWPHVTATRGGAVITITAPVNFGANPNTENFTPAGTITTTTGAMAAGADGNTIDTVLVDGVNILDYPISWAGGNTDTADFLASTIGNSPVNNTAGYTAAFNAGTVTIFAPSTGTAFNGLTLARAVTGTISVTASPADFAGGVDAVAGAAKTVQFTFGGTVEVGDEFTVTLDGTDFGARSNPLTGSDKPITFRSKIYTGRGSLVHYSGIDSPDVFNLDHPTKPGAGFLSINNHSANASEFKSIGVYQDQLVIFTAGATQLWRASPDDTENELLQVVDNVGCIASESVQSYGSLDLFFLDRTGVRSLRARDSSNLAAMTDVGSPIDTLVQAFLRTLTADQIQAARSIIDPDSGRYWLAIQDRVFVFSTFVSPKVYGWTEYDFGWPVDELAEVGGRVYIRTGDEIFLYGGPAGDTQLEEGASAAVVVPFLSMGRPASHKRLIGFDIGAEGAWQAEVMLDPADETKFAGQVILDGTSYADLQIPLRGHSSHVGFRLTFTGDAATKGVLSSLAVHYREGSSS